MLRLPPIKPWETPFTVDTLEDVDLADGGRNKPIDGCAVPAGTYRIELRTGSPMGSRYKRRFGDWHRGMLWLRDVPQFEYVYIHIGNTNDDTLGCILVGQEADSTRGAVYHSTNAYVAVYERIMAAMDAGRRVYIKVE